MYPRKARRRRVKDGAQQTQHSFGTLFYRAHPARARQPVTGDSPNPTGYCAPQKPVPRPR
ncbi:hypothetical protein HMPREF0742_01710 [Rothia aeria F0184]|uniref:Uncharacterized protein n=1 Tax=Rothia aeria F0184 TaxID=888019 RepID=U7V2G6_9MICC|nr:hypothetical protein HMPREF0742_01710 [Rothia aeria F0184]